MIRKWGGTENWLNQKRNHNLKGRGLAAGISHFNLDRLASNTMMSHRLVQFVGKTYGLADSELLYDALNTYHFVDGHPLNDIDGLLRVVSDTLSHVDLSQVETFLADPLAPGKAEILAAVAKASELHIHAIPTFVINGKVVSGAAGPKFFLELFSAVQKSGVVQPPVFADILKVKLK